MVTQKESFLILDVFKFSIANAFTLVLMGGGGGVNNFHIQNYKFSGPSKGKV